MNKSILEIIKELQASGRIVKYRKRSDGGYIITEINGVKYKAAQGNKVARQIANAPLSEFRSRQLKRITPKTKRAAKQRVVSKALKIKKDGFFCKKVLTSQSFYDTILKSAAG